jgi:hypothetical protein
MPGGRAASRPTTRYVGPAPSGRFDNLANETQAPTVYHERPPPPYRRNDLGPQRPPARLGSTQQYRLVNPPSPNPAKPPKRPQDEEAGHRPAVTKPSNVQPSGEFKRRKTDDEHNPMQSVRPPMQPPIRQSGARKVSTCFFP